VTPPRPPAGRGTGAGGAGKRRPGPRRAGRQGTGSRAEGARSRAATARPTAPRPVLGGDQVEGRRAVRELLAARRRRVRDLWVSESAEVGHPLVVEILDLAADDRVPVRRVSRGRLDAEARTDAPQGVLAHAEPLRPAELAALASRRDGAAPFLIALDGVTDPQNLGALLRIADGAGATGLIVARHRAVHVTPTVAKAAAGAVEHVPIALVSGVAGALRDLAAAGVWTVGLDGDAPGTVFDLDLGTEPVALVLGAEGTGLSRLVRERCDVLASIPQRGALASLNVAAAGAVACYEVARRRLAAG